MNVLPIFHKFTLQTSIPHNLLKFRISNLVTSAFRKKFIYATDTLMI